MIGAVGAEHAQWLDDGSEHPHRIALMVAAARVPDVCARLAQGFAQRGVQVGGPSMRLHRQPGAAAPLEPVPCR